MRVRRLLIPVAAAGYGALQALGRTAGSTRQERRVALPGDGVVPNPSMVTDHAISIPAPPERVWPWLTQMGWHLGGYYTPDWVDRWLFPANWPSLDHLDPALVRTLNVGDVIPDGAPGTARYLVHEVEAPRTLVLHSTSHLPPWGRRLGATIDWTWAFVMRPAADGGTRLQLRVRGRTSPWWLTLAYHAALVPADYVMAVGMLRGIRARVTADRPARDSGRTPYRPDEQPLLET
jgi:hypothetical protein